MIASFGEIILRLGTPGHEKIEQARRLELHYGGSEANVLAGLSLMGEQTRLLSCVPESALGDAAVSHFKGHGVHTGFVFRGGERMPLYYLEQGTGPRHGKIIYDRGNGPLNAIRLDDINWNDFFQGVEWLHWSGITPGLSLKSSELTSACLDEATARRIFISCDLHYRKNLWDFGVKPGEIIPDFISRTHLLCADPNTIRFMTGKPAKEGHLSDEDISNEFREVKNAFPQLEGVAMLSREVVNASDQTLKGLMMTGDTLYSSSSFRISPVADRIGGGDAFMAGLIHGWLQNKSPENILEFAAAAAAYKHTVPGDQLVGTMDDIMETMNGKEIRR